MNDRKNERKKEKITGEWKNEEKRYEKKLPSSANLLLQPEQREIEALLLIRFQLDPNLFAGSKSE